MDLIYNPVDFQAYDEFGLDLDLINSYFLNLQTRDEHGFEHLQTSDEHGFDS